MGEPRLPKPEPGDETTLRTGDVRRCRSGTLIIIGQQVHRTDEPDILLRRTVSQIGDEVGHPLPMEESFLLGATDPLGVNVFDILSGDPCLVEFGEGAEKQQIAVLPKGVCLETIHFWAEKASGKDRIMATKIAADKWIVQGLGDQPAYRGPDFATAVNAALADEQENGGQDG